MKLRNLMLLLFYYASSTRSQNAICLKSNTTFVSINKKDETDLENVFKLASELKKSIEKDKGFSTLPTYAQLLQYNDMCDEEKPEQPALSNKPLASTSKGIRQQSEAEQAFVNASIDLYKHSIYYNMPRVPILNQLLYVIVKNPSYKKPNALLNAFLKFLTEGFKYFQSELFSTEWHLTEDLTKFNDYTMKKAKNDKETKKAAEDLKEAIIGAVDAVIRFLKQNNISVNIKTKLLVGKNMLMYSAEANFPEITKLLLDHGAKPNLKTWIFFGKTPVMFAAKACAPAAVELLLSKGADPCAKTWPLGVNAAWLAHENGCHKVIEVIKKYSSECAPFELAKPSNSIEATHQDDYYYGPYGDICYSNEG